MSTAKLTECSKALILVREKMRNGELFLREDAKAVWQSELIFMKQNLDNFRAKSNSLQSEEENNDGTLLINF